MKFWREPTPFVEKLGFPSHLKTQLLVAKGQLSTAEIIISETVSLDKDHFLNSIILFMV